MINCRCISVVISAFLILTLIFLISGCATPPTKTAEPEQGIAAEQRAGASPQEAKTSTTTVKEGNEREVVVCLCEQYTVRKGDSLWWIAKYKDKYNDPYLWPIIYEANKDIIKDPKLLSPGQELGIPREGYALDEIKNIRKKAGAAKPYLPPQEAHLPVD
ncbi:MAG: LysM peptidoglycan-binding domain-containing protein [Syntrophales bacterium]